MCVHERVDTPQFKSLSQQMAVAGFIAITLRGGYRDYTMFANPKHPICIKRAYTDLRNWHPDAIITDQTLSRLADVPRFGNKLAQVCNYDTEVDAILKIDARNVPDSLDLDERDYIAVYRRCEENGYFTEKQPVSAAA